MSGEATTAQRQGLFRRGHAAADFLEAWDWEVLEQTNDVLKVSAHLPERVRNPRGQLFGGFTPTYVDLVALATARGRVGPAGPEQRVWLATTSMQVDYFRPILGPRFAIESRHEVKSGRTHMVLSRFLQDGELAVHAATTMREQVMAVG